MVPLDTVPQGVHRRGSLGRGPIECVPWKGHLEGALGGPAGWVNRGVSLDSSVGGPWKGSLEEVAWRGPFGVVLCRSSTGEIPLEESPGASHPGGPHGGFPCRGPPEGYTGGSPMEGIPWGRPPGWSPRRGTAEVVPWRGGC